MTTLATTTNNDFSYPTAANDGTDFATGIADLATGVDGMWSSGTLASRPSAGVRNRVYYVTDTTPPMLTVDNGSAWEISMLAGAWVALTLPSGVVAASGAYVPSVRVEGDTGRLKGVLENTGGTIGINSTLATIPSGSGCRPTSTYGLIVPATQNYGLISLDIASTGTISTNTGTVPTSNFVQLDGITFSLS